MVSQNINYYRTKKEVNELPEVVRNWFAKEESCVNEALIDFNNKKSTYDEAITYYKTLLVTGIALWASSSIIQSLVNEPNDLKVAGNLASVVIITNIINYLLVDNYKVCYTQALNDDLNNEIIKCLGVGREILYNEENNAIMIDGELYIDNYNPDHHDSVDVGLSADTVFS